MGNYLKAWAPGYQFFFLSVFYLPASLARTLPEGEPNSLSSDRMDPKKKQETKQSGKGCREARKASILPIEW